MANSTVARDTFLEKLDAMLRDMERWSTVAGLRPKRKTTKLAEEAIGEYDAPVLVLHGESDVEIAWIEPVGAAIIGASGRANLRGFLDNQPLVYLESGGSVVRSEGAATGSRKMFSGIDTAGWYWLENPRLGRAKKLTQELFMDLLREVTGQEIRA